MTRDVKITYSVSALIFAVLLSCLFIPSEISSRIAAAAVSVPLCILAARLMKKRTVPSINKGQVLLIVTVAAVLYLTLYYLTGIKFGFFYSPKLTFDSFLKNVIPITVIIVSIEIIRSIILMQGKKWATLLVYFAGIAADCLIYSSFTDISSFNRFMSLCGLYLFPAVTANLFYNYMSKRYGIYPNIAFRLLTTLNTYFIIYRSAMSDSMFSLARLLLPLILLAFIDTLFEKKKRIARKKKSKWRFVGVGAILALMISLVMIISCQFKYGMLVIATESMTGEIDKGDAVIYSELDEDDTVEVGDVIVFYKSDSKIVHRVIDVEKVNGTVRYYTKGDANEDADSGYVTRDNIIGKVKLKLVYLGYPTLMVRELFE